MRAQPVTAGFGSLIITPPHSLLSGSKSGGRGLQIQAEESLGGATSAWPEGWLSLGRLHLAWQALADLMDLGLPAASAGAGATPRALIACPRRGSTPDGACSAECRACVQPSAELGARWPAIEGLCIAFPSLSYRPRSVLTRGRLLNMPENSIAGPSQGPAGRAQLTSSFGRRREFTATSPPSDFEVSWTGAGHARFRRLAQSTGHVQHAQRVPFLCVASAVRCVLALGAL